MSFVDSRWHTNYLRSIHTKDNAGKTRPYKLFLALIDI